MSFQNTANNFNLVQQLASRLLVIDSDYRTQGNNTGFRTESFAIPCKFLALKYINFVNNQYIINNNSNTLRIDNVNYVLTNGNYSATQLRDALNAIVGMPVTWAYSSTTNKFSFTGVNPNYVFDFSIGNVALGVMMGIVEADYDITSLSYTLASPYTAPYMVDLNYTSYVDLVCDEISKYGSSSSGTNTTAGLLARIPIQQYNLYSSVLYEDKTNNYIAFGNNQLGSLTFRLIDQWQNEFDLDDNVNVSIVFDIVC